MRHRTRSLLLFWLAGCSHRDAPAVDSTRTAPPAPVRAAAPSVPDSANLPATRWVVSPRGIGPILAGLPIAALDTALGEHLRPTYQTGSSCAYVHPSGLPDGVVVMVVRDTVARVDVRTRGVLTADSAGVGDAEAVVLKRYEGRIRSTPHKYRGPAGHYLTVTAAPDTTYRLVFETDGRSIVSYHAGRRPEVDLVEGCS